MRFAALVLTTAGLLPLPAAALSLDDARAARALQSRLMVAALKCDDHALHNPVVARHRGLFPQAERLLRARQGGRHDRWVAETANQDSRRASGLGDDACADARPLTEAALASPPEGLPALARAPDLLAPPLTQGLRPSLTRPISFAQEIPYAVRPSLRARAQG